MTAAELAMHAARYFDRFVELRPQAELEAYQWQKLKRQIEYLGATSPFYREKFATARVDAAKVTDLAAFSRAIPVTRKAELIADQEADPPYGRRLCVRPEQVVQLTTTGGTSGAGQEVHALTLADVETVSSMVSWGFFWAGLRPGDPVANSLPVSLSAAGQWLHAAFGQLRVLHLPLGVYDTVQKLQFIRRFEAKAVVATPSYLRTLQQTAEERRFDLAGSSVNILLTATEAFSVAWARRMEQAWGARLFEWYGATQRVVAWSCERGAVHDDQHGVLHYLPQFVLFEVVDPKTGTPAEPGGEGEAIVTFLDSEGSPLLRFATGDKVRYLGWRCCPCGRPLPGIESGTITRYDDMLKVRGVNFWPSAVDAVLLAHVAVDDYRGRVFLDDRGRERITLRLRLRGGDAGMAAAVVPTLEAELRARIGLGMTIELAHDLEGEFRDERTKARRWRDDRRH